MNIQTILGGFGAIIALVIVMAGGVLVQPPDASAHTPIGLAQAQTSTPAGGEQGSASGPTTRGMVGPIIGVVLVFMASAVAFGFALGLRRRINAIAGPDPNADDEEEL